jgi:hypothetical protein
VLPYKILWNKPTFSGVPPVIELRSWRGYSLKGTISNEYELGRSGFAKQALRESKWFKEKDSTKKEKIVRGRIDVVLVVETTSLSLILNQYHWFSHQNYSKRPRKHLGFRVHSSTKATGIPPNENTFLSFVGTRL